MADIGERLAKWLTDTIMGYVESLYQMAACQLDLLVGGIINKIQSLMDELLASILGPLQSILGAIASPLNLIGGAVNFILDILGISCSGPDTTCADKRKECFNGEEEDEDDDENGLDKLLDELDKGIDDLFPETGRDDNIYTCPDAYEGNTHYQTLMLDLLVEIRFLLVKVLPQVVELVELQLILLHQQSLLQRTIHSHIHVNQLKLRKATLLSLPL